MATSRLAPGDKIRIRINGQVEEAEVLKVGENGSALVMLQGKDGRFTYRTIHPTELPKGN